MMVSLVLLIALGSLAYRHIDILRQEHHSEAMTRIINAGAQEACMVLDHAEQQLELMAIMAQEHSAIIAAESMRSELIAAVAVQAAAQAVAATSATHPNAISRNPPSADATSPADVTNSAEHAASEAASLDAASAEVAAAASAMHATNAAHAVNDEALVKALANVVNAADTLANVAHIPATTSKHINDTLHLPLPHMSVAEMPLPDLGALQGLSQDKLISSVAILLPDGSVQYAPGQKPFVSRLPSWEQFKAALTPPNTTSIANTGANSAVTSVHIRPAGATTDAATAATAKATNDDSATTITTATTATTGSSAAASTTDNTPVAASAVVAATELDAHKHEPVHKFVHDVVHEAAQQRASFGTKQQPLFFINHNDEWGCFAVMGYPLWQRGQLQGILLGEFKLSKLLDVPIFGTVSDTEEVILLHGVALQLLQHKFQDLSPNSSTDAAASAVSAGGAANTTEPGQFLAVGGAISGVGKTVNHHNVSVGAVGKVDGKSGATATRLLQGEIFKTRVWDSLQNDLRHGRSGIIYTQTKKYGQELLSVYTPIGRYQLFMVLTVPVPTLFSDLMSIFPWLLSLGALLLVVGIGSALYWYQLQRHEFLNIKRQSWLNHMISLVRQTLIQAYKNPEQVHKALHILARTLQAQEVTLVLAKDVNRNVRYSSSIFDLSSGLSEEERNKPAPYHGVPLHDLNWQNIWQQSDSSGCLILNATSPQLLLKVANLLSLERSQIKSLVLVRLEHNDKQHKGALFALNPKDCEQARRLLVLNNHSFSQICALRVEYQDLYHRGLRDALTGLKNRNAFAQDLPLLDEQSYRKAPSPLYATSMGLSAGGGAFASGLADPVEATAALAATDSAAQAEQEAPTWFCVYIDLNGLHDLNNQLGHDSGDEMLKTTALYIVDAFGNESSYRIGGDEFVIIANGLSADDIEDKLENLQQRLNLKSYHISSGYALLSVGDHLEQALADAEAMMYRNKKAYYSAGKDRNKARYHNEALERILSEKKDRDLFLEAIADYFLAVFVIDLNHDVTRTIYQPSYFDKMQQENNYSFKKSLPAYVELFLSGQAKERFQAFTDFDYLIPFVDAGQEMEFCYVQNNGLGVRLRVIPTMNGQNRRDTLWIFVRNNEHNLEPNTAQEIVPFDRNKVMNTRTASNIIRLGLALGAPDNEDDPFIPVFGSSK